MLDWWFQTHLLILLYLNDYSKFSTWDGFGKVLKILKDLQFSLTLHQVILILLMKCIKMLIEEQDRRFYTKEESPKHYRNCSGMKKVTLN